MMARQRNAALLGASMLLAVGLTAGTALVPSSPAAAASKGSTSSGTWTTSRVNGPARTLVKDDTGTVRATLTDGSRSVVLVGATRQFAEPSTTSATVTTSAWVRLLAAPFAGSVDLAWVQAQLVDSSPDVLAHALAYTTGAPEVLDGSGAHVSGDASYGPLVNGARQEGSDWNDYYGVAATYGDQTDAPEAAQFRAVDCSGYVRLVFGHRGGLPMTLTPDGVRLPRRAVQMDASAPGTLVVPNRGTQVTSFGALLAGDLVLFDANTDDGTAVDHVGIYLGKDSAGRHRFVSSRKTADGPTMGDVGGGSRLDGTGLYATSFRSVRRL